MAEDVEITIVYKDDSDTAEKENTNMASVLNLNLDEVTVKAHNPYVEIGPDAVSSNDINFEGATIENLGEGSLLITLDCGDTLVANTSKLVSALLKAADLPAKQ